MVLYQREITCMAVRKRNKNEASLERRQWLEVASKLGPTIVKIVEVVITHLR